MRASTYVARRSSQGKWHAEFSEGLFTNMRDLDAKVALWDSVRSSVLILHSSSTHRI